MNERTIDVSVWYAQQVMENYSDPYDAIEWLVQNLKEDAFQTCAECYDEAVNQEINRNK